MIYAILFGSGVVVGMVSLDSSISVLTVKNYKNSGTISFTKTSIFFPSGKEIRELCSSMVSQELIKLLDSNHYLLPVINGEIINLD